MHESNRALAKRWFNEVWNDRRPETMDELWAPDGIGHMEGGDCTIREFKQAREGLLSAFPDFRVTVEETAAEGDHVVVRWRVQATHKGPGLGMEATGRPVTFRGMTWLTFRDGKVVEGWDSWNQGALIVGLRTNAPAAAAGAGGI